MSYSSYGFIVNKIDSLHQVSQIYTTSYIQHHVDNYMKKQGVQALLVEKCVTKEEAPEITYVEVPCQNKDAVMCTDFWPLGVKIDG